MKLGSDLHSGDPASFLPEEKKTFFAMHAGSATTGRRRKKRFFPQTDQSFGSEAAIGQLAKESKYVLV